MKLLKTPIILLLGMQALWPATLALAQVPPHKPGTICQTPKFWCWAQTPGQLGATCHCSSPYGPVAGNYV